MQGDVSVLCTGLLYYVQASLYSYRFSYDMQDFFYLVNTTSFSDCIMPLRNTLIRLTNRL